MASNYLDKYKYKYNQIQNSMYKKFRILNSGKFSRFKSSNPVKSNNYQYFPIESDNSKLQGRTIYLATQDDQNDNKDNDKYENIRTEPNIKSYITTKKKLLIEDKNYIAQRTIYFSYFRKYNYTLSRRSLGHNKKQIYISDTKIYDINKSFIEMNREINNNIHKVNNHNLNIFNIIEAKQVNIIENENEGDNDTNRISTYIKKRTSNQYLSKRDDIQEEDNIYNRKVKSKIINRFNDIQRKNNNEEILNINPINDNKATNIEETQKEPISKNSSLNEYYNITTAKNILNLNKSLDETPKNKSLLYKSLDGNIFDNLNNSKIMEKKFLDGIKNPQRKISLLKAMDRYNRFKFRGKFNINLKNKKIDNNNNVDNNNNNEENNIKEEKDNFDIKTDIKITEDYNINNESDNNKNNENNMYIEDDENKITDIKEDDNENENEFSFNSELRKNEKKNHLGQIVANENKKEEEDNNKNNANINYEVKEDKEEKEEIQKEENINEKNNMNIFNENKIEIENNQENENSNFRVKIIDDNKESNIEENNDNLKEKIINEQNQDEQEEQEQEQEQEIIIKEEKDKIIKPEINISIDKKENSNSKKEKIIPEINISIDNKDPNQENKSDANNNNNSSNNIINNSINININNNDSSNKNDIREQKQYMQLNNIKYKNNLKPGYFIRKVVREEHYYIDENGKEKILQVKQEFINNEDKKKMKTKNPHKKRYINTSNKINENSNKKIDENNLKNNNEQNKEIKNETKDKNNEHFEGNNNIIDISTRKENKEIEIDIDSFSNKGLENRPENIVEKKNEFNDSSINDNLSSASGPVTYPNNNYNNYFKMLEKNNYVNYNKIKENTGIYRRRDKENNIINRTNIQPEQNIITINRSKNFETKTHLIKPRTTKEYLSNLQLKSSDIKTISTIKSLNDSFKKEDKPNINKININIKPKINTSNNYIKVNKVDKLKSINTETYHKINLNLNKYSLYNNNTLNSERKRRQSSKNHAYHEINLTTTKNNNLLTSNSLSQYFNEGNNELNTSTNTNKNSLNTNISERNYIQRYTVNTNKILDDINNNDTIRLTRFHRNKNIRKEMNNSLNKDHHRFYESKSIKKRNNHNILNQYSISKNSEDSYKKEYKSKKIESINKRDKGYFYSNYDLNNNNNSKTAKKINRTTTYYH